MGDNKGAPEKGRILHTVGQCTDCGKVYTVQRFADDVIHPIGTDGTCLCGNAEFKTPTGH